jgi:trehalose 6-phosphate phosphatase
MAEADQAPPSSILNGAALFLDFDGTLVELAETPGAIRVAPGLRPLLDRLSRRLDGRLAIISGRAVADLERHLDCSGIAVSGSHGLELRLASGEGISLVAAGDLSEAREEVSSFAAAVPGLLVEEKPASVAVHFRKAPAEEERVTRFMSDLARRNGLTVQHGKLVAELRPWGADKGDALRALMNQPEFVGAHPIFVGDDLTDEHAFEAARDLGGGGVLVGPPRETAARWRLADVGVVSDWLHDAAER